MAYALTQTRFDFPHVVSSTSKRFLMDIAEEFATVIAPKPSKDIESTVDEDWIDPTDNRLGDLPMEDEPDYDPWIDDSYPDIFDDERYYDFLSSRRANDGRPECGVCPLYGPPMPNCRQHSYVYSRTEYEKFGEERYYMSDPYGYQQDAYDGLYDWCNCGDLPKVGCASCGGVYDKWLWNDYDSRLSVDDYDLSDHLDDVEYVFNPNYIEENPEMAEHDIVETYTNWENMLIRFDTEQYEHDIQEYKSRRRHEINSSPRIKRRDGSVKWRGCRRDWEDRVDYDRRMKMKYAYVD